MKNSVLQDTLWDIVFIKPLLSRIGDMADFPHTQGQAEKDKMIRE